MLPVNISISYWDQIEEDIDELHRELFLWRLSVGVCELITALIGLPANGLVAVISCYLLKKKCIRNGINASYTNHHLCILSMAIGDLLFAAGHCPIMFAHYVINIDLDDFWCRFMYFVTHCSTVVSSLSLLCLNLDKFFCVKYPLRYYTGCRHQRVLALIVGGWALAVGWSFFFVLGPMVDGFEESCTPYVHQPYLFFALFVVPFFIFPITLSLLISLYVFAATLKARRGEFRCRMQIDTSYRYSVIALRRCRRSSNGDSASLNPSAKLNSAPRVAWKIRSALFVFITTLWSAVTCLPYRSAFLAFHFHAEVWLARLALALFAIMVANAAGNPCITLLTQNKYRDKAKAFFARWLKPKYGVEAEIGISNMATFRASSVFSRTRIGTF